MARGRSSGMNGEPGVAQRLEDILAAVQNTQNRLNAIEQKIAAEENVDQPNDEEVLGEQGGQPNNNPLDRQARMAAELARDIKQISPPKFEGTVGGDDAEAWLSEIEKYFSVRNFSNESKTVWAVYNLTKEASSWWDNKIVELGVETTAIPWIRFKEYFRNRWLPQLYYDEKMTEFLNLLQGKLTVIEYWERFTKLMKYVPLYQHDEKIRIRKFILGLNPNISREVDMHSPATMEDVYEKAIRQEQKLKSYAAMKEEQRAKDRSRTEQSTSKKAWNRQNGNKPKFSKDVAVKPTVNMKNNGGRNGVNGVRKGPIGGCFICGLDHYASNCPQRKQGGAQQQQPQNMNTTETVKKT